LAAAKMPRGSARVHRLDFPYPFNVESLFLRLSGLAGSVWLDSGRPGSTMGRYDILSALPSETNLGDMQRINARLNEHAGDSDNDLPFCGGWIGYFGYAYRHPSFGIIPLKSNPLPKAQFGWHEWALVIDHQEQRAHLVFMDSCPQATRDLVQTALQSESRGRPYHCGTFAADESREFYLANLAKIHEYLLAGDCYQVNYTQRFSAPFDGSAPMAYLTLRNTVPSPFSAFLNLNGSSVMSISPERFIAIRGRQAITQPIKGTAPRGKTSEEDKQLRNSLSQSGKNRAENLMIVDLLRNDFNMNCLPHSVKVPRLFELQSFNNVHHLVSTISGTIRPGISHPDFIASCFPGGSITGAPKKRAMEIIEELESHSRSVYCGAIGYFSTNGNSDFNIAIRSLVQHEQRIFAWAGGGIVADSDPIQEYEESLHKIGSLLSALTKGSALDLQS